MKNLLLKKLLTLALLCTPVLLFSDEGLDESFDPIQTRNARAHEIARGVGTYFGASCAGSRLLNKWYLCGDLVFGKPQYLFGAPQAWHTARNFDLSFLGVPANLPMDICLAHELSKNEDPSFKKNLALKTAQDVALRIIAGYGAYALMLAGHELSHSLVRYLLTGTKSTIFLGSSWGSGLGIAKEGESKKPLLSLFWGRFLVRGGCLSTGTSKPDIDTERLLPYPTWKGLAISMAGGVGGICTAKALQGLCFLIRNKKEFKAEKIKILKGAARYCCNLDNATLFNLYNMLYPAYGLDAYNLWWFLGYHLQRPFITDKNTEPVPVTK
ncbi:TPA: hypothetical protein DDZ86_04610 [Candidatus Dependentiae bacterium]|nr:MAG: hypothetical protein UW09_C0002G0153 [candidate division TM6 bacterium GW2011_GWF2_43_87]HBL98895.1 hypothetical protein [Candidatus Dependentiae bacterium]